METFEDTQRAEAESDAIRCAIEELCRAGFDLVASGPIEPDVPELRVTRAGETFAWLTVAGPMAGWFVLEREGDQDLDVSPTVRQREEEGRRWFHLQTRREAEYLLAMLVERWGG